MNILISVDKKEFTSVALKSQLEAFAKNVLENETQIILMPLAGHLVDLLHVLRDNDIPYTTTHLGETRSRL